MAARIRRGMPVPSTRRDVGVAAGVKDVHDGKWRDSSPDSFSRVRIPLGEHRLGRQGKRRSYPGDRVLQLQRPAPTL